MRWLPCLLLTGCGLGGGSLNTDDQNTTIQIRVVNLFSTGQGSAGPSMDVYRAQSAFLGAASEPTPVVSDLAYGEVSAAFHPLNNSDILRFFNAGTTDKSTGFAGFDEDTTTLQDDDLVTIVVDGSSPGAAGADLIPGYELVIENRDANTPAIDSSHALLYMDEVAINAYSSQDPGLNLGSSGSCLTGSGPSGTTFTFPPGDITVGLFLLPQPSGIPDCTGSPAFGPVTVSAAAAGSRTWLLPYGPQWSDKRVVTAPFLSP